MECHFHIWMTCYSLNVNEWKFHSPIEWNSCKPLKKEWFCTLNSKFPLIKSENHSKKSELPLIWGVKRRTTRKRIVLRLTPQTSGNSLFLESFSLYMSGNLLFNVQNHSFLSGVQEFHSFGEWNFHSFTFREYVTGGGGTHSTMALFNTLIHCRHSLLGGGHAGVHMHEQWFWNIPLNTF